MYMKTLLIIWLLLSQNEIKGEHKSKPSMVAKQHMEVINSRNTLKQTIKKSNDKRKVRKKN